MSDDANEQRSAISQPLNIEAFQSASSAIALEIGAASVSGPLRSQNTDHYLALRLGRLQETLLTSLAAVDLPPRFEEYGYALLVADGLGESGAGARASRVALSALAHLAIRYGKWNVRIGPETPSDVREQGEFFYRQVNDAVFQAGKADPRLADMATSLTALYIAEGHLFFAHVGHSSAFLLRDGILIQLTMNHTLTEQRRMAGRPLRLERARRDLGHLVTETIGGRPIAPDVEVEHFNLSSGDRLLLCTNGLTDVVTDEQIADALAPRRRPQEDCGRLIDLARAGGGPDDVTVLLADYRLRSDPTPPGPRVGPLTAG